MSGEPRRSARTLRSRLDHPVVDADGHIVESIPAVVEVMRAVAGSSVADRFAASVPSFGSRRSRLLAATESFDERPPGVFIPPWWTVASDPLDRATAFLPGLLHDRLDEMGLDFTVLYTSVGLACFGHPDDEVRRGSCRALNIYLAELCDGLGDRLTPAAVIPAHTPEEAVTELEHAVVELGLKAAVVNCCVSRTEHSGRSWVDLLALDSIHDYDPVWRRFVDLGVAVATHSPTMGLDLRQSRSRYVFNHIGTFAAGGDAVAKALVLGGVTHRFPSLNVAFLEGGVSWGVQLLADLLARWEKRGGARIGRLDPGAIDPEEWDRLLDRHGGERFADPDLRASLLAQSDNPPPELDDFRDSGITRPEDLRELFDRFYFGCEADEATVGWAFAARTNPLGAVLKPVLGSDIGHWDVPDMTGVLPEALELVADGRIDADQFRAFACDNPIQLHAGMNPTFFDGTSVEGYARELVGSADTG